MGTVRITETTEVTVTEGVIEVDTTSGPVTLFLRPGHGKSLTVTKISTDPHTVTLYCERGLIGQGEIVIFGVPAHSRARQGQVSSISLKGQGNHWMIVS